MLTSKQKACLSRHRFPVMIAGAFAVSIAILLLSPTFQECVGVNQQADQGDGFFQPIAKFFGHLWWCGGIFAHENGEAITALATVVMAAFTGTLWWASSEQGKIAQRSIDLARDEFNATHRPKVVVQIVKLLNRGDSARNAVVYYEIANAGDGTAYLLSQAAFAYIQTAESAFTPDFKDATEDWPKGHASSEMRPGSWQKISVICKSVDSRYDEFAHNGGKLFIVGRVNYRGDDNAIRHTGFCRRYSQETGMWHTEEKSEYEYAY